MASSDDDITLGGIMTLLRNLDDSRSTSLFQYTKRSSIHSRVFIENSLAGEDILTPLIENMMNLYTGLILTALSMNKFVYGSKKVKDFMSIVATESASSNYVLSDDLVRSFFNQCPQMDGGAWDKVKNFFGGGKSDNDQSGSSNTNPKVDINVSKDTINRNTYDNRSINTTVNNNQRTINSNQHTVTNNNTTNITNIKQTGRDKDDPNDLGFQGGRVLNPVPKDVSFPSGRIIEVDFNSPEGGGGFTIAFMLNLSPTFISSNVVDQFVGCNFAPSLKQRWMQMSVGEISFIKDFIFAMDLRDKRFKALRDDSTGALREMESRRRSNTFSHVLRNLSIDQHRQNIANTILIFDKATFDRSCSNAGLRFNKFADRQKFFQRTFTMMVAVIDTMHNFVDLYYHGLEHHSTFSLQQLKKNSKTEATDLVSIMKSYASNMAPKF